MYLLEADVYLLGTNLLNTCYVRGEKINFDVWLSVEYNTNHLNPITLHICILSENK